MLSVGYLHRAAGRGADERSRAHGGGGRQAALPLLLIDAVALGLRQLQEVLHGAQVDQQRLGGRLGVLLLAQDLGQQALRDGRERGGSEEQWSHHGGAFLKKRDTKCQRRLRQPRRRDGLTST